MKTKIFLITFLMLITVFLIWFYFKYKKKTIDMKTLNNPGNIRQLYTSNGIETGVDYLGELKPTLRHGFKTFKDIAYGYRAMAQLLGAYIYNGYNTVEKIINRYAPPSDKNPTNDYINFVAQRMGVDVDEILDRKNINQFKSLMGAIARFEQGTEPNIDDLNKGYSIVFSTTETI